MTDSKDSQPDEESDTPQPGPDEAFCMECGEIIKKQAEICTECGVRQQSNEASTPQQPRENSPQNSRSTNGANTGLSQRRQYELEKIASNDKATVALIGFLVTPVAYWMLGKKMLAIANLLTLNFFLMGPIIVPIHCYSMIGNAEDELRMAGVGGY